MEVAGGATVDAAWLVIATPFVPLRNVRFSPALPGDLSAAVASVDLGPAAKVATEYRRRAWVGADGARWEPTFCQSIEPGSSVAVSGRTVLRVIARFRCSLPLFLRPKSTSPTCWLKRDGTTAQAQNEEIPIRNVEIQPKLLGIG